MLEGVGSQVVSGILLKASVENGSLRLWPVFCSNHYNLWSISLSTKNYIIFYNDYTSITKKNESLGLWTHSEVISPVLKLAVGAGILDSWCNSHIGPLGVDENALVVKTKQKLLKIHMRNFTRFLYKKESFLVKKSWNLTRKWILWEEEPAIRTHWL